MTDAVRTSGPPDVLSLVLEALPVGVWIMDQTGRITYGNPAARQIWAGGRYVGPEQFGEYRGWWAGSNTPIAPDEWAAARAIQKGQTSVDEVVDIECFDGTRKTILNSALPLRASDGSISGAIIINQDISERRRIEVDRDRLIRQLQTAMAEVHTLSGLLPICASCKKIRDGANQWHNVESYIADRSTAQFSHGLCPDCVDRLYPSKRQPNQDQRDAAQQPGP
jgi:hypothetical protein